MLLTSAVCAITGEDFNTNKLIKKSEFLNPIFGMAQYTEFLKKS